MDAIKTWDRRQSLFFCRGIAIYPCNPLVFWRAGSHVSQPSKRLMFKSDVVAIKSGVVVSGVVHIHNYTPTPKQMICVSHFFEIIKKQQARRDAAFLHGRKLPATNDTVSRHIMGPLLPAGRRCTCPLPCLPPLLHHPCIPTPPACLHHHAHLPFDEGGRPRMYHVSGRQPLGVSVYQASKPSGEQHRIDREGGRGSGHHVEHAIHRTVCIARGRESTLVTLPDCKHAERAAMVGAPGTPLLESIHVERGEGHALRATPAVAWYNGFMRGRQSGRPPRQTVSAGKHQ